MDSILRVMCGEDVLVDQAFNGLSSCKTRRRSNVSLKIVPSIHHQISLNLLSEGYADKVSPREMSVKVRSMLLKSISILSERFWISNEGS